jgi:predicted TPR repeat methyltransferase
MFRDIVEASPKHVAAWRKYAEALAQLDDLSGADVAARTANTVEADHVADVGASLLFHGDSARARSFFERALALDPECLSAHWLMGECLATHDERDAALQHYRKCLEIAPDRQGPAFMIAALGDDASPDRAPDDYVEGFFDWYADHFETHLVDDLKYDGPQHVAAALKAARPEGVGTLIDLGCGTGLAGAAVRKMADRMIGVDLSPAMLEKAEAKGIYETLLNLDLVAALETLPDHSADAALAADVLVYVGAIEPVLHALHRVLKTDAVFIASFEEGREIESWELFSAGRYRHCQGYVRRAAAACGFDVTAMSTVPLREEYSVPVPSLVVTFHKRP